MLLSGLGEHGFRLGSRIERVDQDAKGVTITLADGSTESGDILIGADGIHSTVRAQLFGKELPRYTGNVAWRGLVPAERVAHLDLGSVVGVWMGPNRSIVQYYVSAGKTFNWIGISRSAPPARESWLAEGKVEDALAEYDGWHSTIRTIIGATPKVLRQALYDREPLPDWQVGRVVLLGDAAHPMMPFYAQGGAQSIEDAYVLAGCIAAAQDRPLEALARFVKLRQPRTAWMQGLVATRGRALPDERRRGDQRSATRGCEPTASRRPRASRRSRRGFTATTQRRFCRQRSGRDVRRFVTVLPMQFGLFCTAQAGTNEHPPESGKGFQRLSRSQHRGRGAGLLLQLPGRASFLRLEPDLGHADAADLPRHAHHARCGSAAR